jgi:hypothetical protein
MDGFTGRAKTGRLVSGERTFFLQKAVSHGDIAALGRGAIRPQKLCIAKLGLALLVFCLELAPAGKASETGVDLRTLQSIVQRYIILCTAQSSQLPVQHKAVPFAQGGSSKGRSRGCYKETLTVYRNTEE